MIKFWFSNNYPSGGNFYNRQVPVALSPLKFLKTIELGKYYNYRGETYLTEILAKIFFKSNAKDISILDYNIASNLINKTNYNNLITIFHHFDTENVKKKKKRIKKFNRFLSICINNNVLVVVVSQYWKEKLLSYGIKNIKVIYNSFNTKLYVASKAKKQFLKYYGLENKPIVYIGKNSNAKTYSIYNQIKNLSDKYQVVTTGSTKEFNGPIHLDLNLLDYINLLYHSSVTVLLTPFNEGWSRIAHESILCGTPVIGRESGGMKELLELTDQKIIKTDENLFQEVEHIIESKKRIDKSCQEKIKKYDLTYFREEWMNIISHFN